MHTKAPQELHTAEGHQALIGIVVVILIGKSNATLVNAFDTRIVDCYPVRVFAQVAYYLTGITQRWFAVNHPGLGVAMIKDGLKLRQTVFLFQLASQSFKQLASKNNTELSYRR